MRKIVRFPSPVLLAWCVCICYVRSFTPFVPSYLGNTQNRKFSGRAGLRLRLSMSQELQAQEPSLPEALKKWSFKVMKSSAEISVSDASSKVEFIRDVMGGILLTSRILDAEEGTDDVNLVIAFPKLNIDAAAISQYSVVLNDLLQRVAQRGKDMFPIEIARTAELHLKSPENPTCLLVMRCHQVVLLKTNFADIDTVPTNFEDVYDNSIESFPFPSVYDFISEINRPPDPHTMASLRFNFKPQDFRGDIKKAAKKKNPQEILDGINCKLTRLQNWKDVLLAHEDNTPSPFVEIYGWSEDMKSKYRSLKFLASKDPKKAMDTQYDKRKVFIQIIDQWSDRLKRYFKYIYQSQRANVDAQELAENSALRLEMKSLTSMFSHAPFLDFEGPQFAPGCPSMPKMMEDDRSGFTSVDFPFEPVIIDSARWIDRINEVQHYAFPQGLEGGRSSLSLPSRSIRMHAYSRGYSTERLMRDVWIALADWSKISDSENSFKLCDFHTSPACGGYSQHSDFVNSIKKINAISRQESVSNAKGVKDLFRHWADVSPELLDWWSEFIGDLNLEDMLEKLMQDDPNISWTGIMDRILNGEFSDGDYFSASGAQAEWDKNCMLWEKYRPLVEKAEFLRKSVNWSSVESRGLEDYLSAVEDVSKVVDLTQDIITVPVLSSTDATVSLQAEDALLFVMPRMFRGIGETELGNFLEFCKLILEQTHHFALDGLALKLIPLHPEMVNQKGIPDYSRRAPHPAILFFLATR